MKPSGKWAFVCTYTIGLFVITPYLPNLIEAATSRWSISGVSRFVLGVEIAIASLILVLSFVFLIRRKKKAALFLLSMGGIFLLSFILYQFIPNPYEFTHLPEYAILSMLLLWALSNEKVKRTNAKKGNRLTSVIIRNPYFMSAEITSIIGTIDEIYQHFLPNRFFTVYDIFLNILGGILGLLIIWGIKR